MMHIFHKYIPVKTYNFYYVHFRPSWEPEQENTHTTVVYACSCGKVKSKDFDGVFTLEDIKSASGTSR